MGIDNNNRNFIINSPDPLLLGAGHQFSAANINASLCTRSLPVRIRYN